MRPSNVSVICCVIAGWVTGSAAQVKEPLFFGDHTSLVEQPLFDCSTKEVWSPKKAEWCCENEQKRCPSPPPPPPPPLFDCSTREVWSPKKVEWCCENERRLFIIKDLFLKYCSPPPPPPAPCTSFDGVVWSDEFQEWVVALFRMADADGSGTNDRDELRVLLSYLQVEAWSFSSEKHGKDCFDKLEELLSQSLNTELLGIGFEDFFAWLRECLPKGHVWRDCPPPPPSPPPSSPPPQPLFDCSTKEVWSPEKAKWCCENEQINCPPCVDTTKCKKKKCKGYDAAKLQKCKKTCGLCEPLPPSAPPPPPPPPALPSPYAAPAHCGEPRRELRRALRGCDTTTTRTTRPGSCRGSSFDTCSCSCPPDPGAAAGQQTKQSMAAHKTETRSRMRRSSGLAVRAA